MQEIYFGPYDTSKPSEVSGCIDTIDSVRVLGSVSVFQDGKLVLQIRGLKAYRLIQYKKRKAKETPVVANGKPSEPSNPQHKIPDATASVPLKRKIAIGGNQPSEATERAEPVKHSTTVTATVQEPTKPKIPTSTPSPSTSQSHSAETDRNGQLTVPVETSMEQTAPTIPSSSSQFPHILGFDGNFCLDAHGNAATWDQLKNGRTTNRAVFKNREKIGREAAFIDRDLSLFDPEFFGEIQLLIHLATF